MNMKQTLAAALLLAATASATAQDTFRNPMMWADVPDPDVIRVGDDLYLVSTTMHLMPGGPVMKSKDLVNWRTVSYLFDRLADSPRYDLVGGTVYGRGQWATSLRYDKGTFWALFSPNDEPYRSYLYRTDSPERGWTLHARLPHYHDASLFFDDDGRAYVFSGSGGVRLRELNADLTGPKEGGTDVQLNVRDEEEDGLLEGSRVLKHEGKYYLMMISWPKGKPRRQLCYRADRIEGPYEKRVVLCDKFAGFPYVGQGTIVDAPDGKWYGVIFQDRDAVGRVLTVEPCRWTDGWPVLGDSDGRIPAVMARPVGGCADIPLVVGDEFGGSTLRMEWQWNHNPVNDAWSLTEREGWLRLKACRVVDNVFAAPNTLSQRMEGPACTGEVCIDFSGMRDGDRAGFAAFNGHSGLLTVARDGRRTELRMSTAVVNFDGREKRIAGVDEEVQERVRLKGGRVWLRIDADFRLGRDVAAFYYSADGRDWRRIGADFKMRYDYTRMFMGTRYAVFNYATRQAGGHVDVDFFRYERKAE